MRVENELDKESQCGIPALIVQQIDEHETNEHVQHEQMMSACSMGIVEQRVEFGLFAIARLARAKCRLDFVHMAHVSDSIALTIDLGRGPLVHLTFVALLFDASPFAHVLGISTQCGVKPVRHVPCVQVQVHVEHRGEQIDKEFDQTYVDRVTFHAQIDQDEIRVNQVECVQKNLSQAPIVLVGEEFTFVANTGRVGVASVLHAVIR